VAACKRGWAVQELEVACNKLCADAPSLGLNRQTDRSTVHFNEKDASRVT
jgi:hypothetical protein